MMSFIKVILLATSLPHLAFRLHVLDILGSLCWNSSSADYCPCVVSFYLGPPCANNRKRHQWSILHPTFP